MSLEVYRYTSFARKFTYDYDALHGKTEANIEEAIYLLQNQAEDADNGILLKRRTDSDVVIDDATKEVTVQITDADQDNIAYNTDYKEIFGIKFTGDTRFRWTFLKDSTTNEDSTIKFLKPWVTITS